MSRCSHCGKENPAPYRFCGSCGKPIEAPRSLSSALMEAPQQQPVKATLDATPSHAEPARKEEPVFSGPSFLGLSGDSGGGAHYLLDEEEESPSGRGRMVVALVILLLAGGLLGWRWYYGSFPWQAKAVAPASTNLTAQTNVPQEPTSNPTNSDSQSAVQQPSGTAAPDSAAAQNAQNATSTGTASAAPSTGTGDAAQPNATPNKDNSSDADNNAATSDANTPVATPPAAAPAKKTAQLKETAPVSRSTAKRVAMNEEDSQESEAAALLTQGERYLYGNGVAQNCGRAQDSIRAAADHASVQALTDLGTMYSTGHCVKKDLPTAYRWYVKALHQQPANARISSDLQALWNQMTPQEKQTAMQSR